MPPSPASQARATKRSRIEATGTRGGTPPRDGHSNGEVHFFHQPWHHDTRDGPIGSENARMGGPFFCVVPAVEPDRARAIAGFWAFIASRGEQIGYALLGYALRDDTEAVFDPNTGLLAMPHGRGLSCSTFVLVLFRSVRLPYIDTVDWPVHRPGDREAQEWLVQNFEVPCNDRAHVEWFRGEIGCERVRLEEVAGAALFPVLPVRHPDVEDAGIFFRGGLCVLAHFRDGMN